MRKQTKLVGLRWLRNGNADDEDDSRKESGNSGKSQQAEQQIPQNVQYTDFSVNQGEKGSQSKDMGGKQLNSKQGFNVMD